MARSYEVEMADGEKITIEGVTEVKQVYGFLEFRNAAYEQVISIRAELIRTYGVVEPEVIAPRVSRKVVTRSRR
jgi:hypothetical protein